MKKSTLLKVGGILIVVSVITVILIATGIISIPKPSRGPQQNDMVIDAKTRTEVIQRLITELNNYYVFPEKAKEMENAVLAKLQAGDYDDITSAEELAATLTADIQAVTKDRHLDVAYSEAVIRSQEEQDSQTSTPEQLARMQANNYGIKKVDHLPLNIGYLDLRSFAPTDLVAPKLAEAMTSLSGTESLIIDLRFNNGGEPKTVALLASYLFEERTRLNDIYDRGTNKTEQYWTSEQVDGTKFGSTKKVYLLISDDTFSAAEDFAYALKNLKRATLIGKSTGGGAHPGTERRLTDHFGSIVPTARSISPITNTDWEGVGVIPDIEMNPDKALLHAQMLILQEMLAKETNQAKRDQIQQELDKL